MEQPKESYGALPEKAPPPFRAAPRAALALLGACALAGGGITLARPRAELTISDVDDGMTADCSSRAAGEDFAAALGARLLGWTRLPNPVGAAFLMDRGGWAALRGGGLGDYAWDYGDAGTAFPYDFTALYAAVAHGYAGELRMYTEGKTSAPAFSEGCDLTYSSATGCTESCVQDAFQALDGGAYAGCADPVEAAFLLAPDLIKECVDTDARGACFQCISLCVGGAREVFLNCGALTGGRAPHDAASDAAVRDAKQLR